jgi:Thermophilic metalloprotease (M29)
MGRHEAVGAAMTLKAFTILLEKCLNITSRDQLLIVFDESLNQFLPALVGAIESADLSATFVCIPKSYQRYLLARTIADGRHDYVELPTCVVAAISASTAMATFLDSDPETSAIRKAVNHCPRPRNCRLATVPGISQDVLASIIDAPFDEILKDCERLAWILGESRHAEIESYDRNGNPHTLNLQLNGWDSEPIMSPGLLLPGSWGNVPPGETFCCPRPETVNGTICINGSVPRHVIGPGEEILLKFENGTLIAWSSPNRSAALEFFDSESARAASNGDKHWNTFAELGIGMNPKIRQLTGNPLLDEKAIETLHVAIGDNSTFGDNVVSLVHHDFITLKPTLRLDGREVLSRGELQRALIDAMRGDLHLAPQDLPDDVIVYLRESKVGVHNNLLQRRLSKAYRINYVQMANPSTSALLADLCDALKIYNGVHLATFVTTYPVFGSTPTTDLLAILNHYRALNLRPTTLSGTKPHS